MMRFVRSMGELRFVALFKQEDDRLLSLTSFAGATLSPWGGATKLVRLTPFLVSLDILKTSFNSYLLGLACRAGVWMRLKYAMTST